MPTESNLNVFCQSAGLKLKSVLVGYMPDESSPKDKRWPHFAWRVTLTRSDQSFTTDYSTGTGHAKPVPRTFQGTDREWLANPKSPVPPTAANVLSSLLSDAQCASDSFDDFCGNFGYDTDSRKALAIYLECQTIGTAMRRLLGNVFDAACEAARNECCTSR